MEAPSLLTPKDDDTSIPHEMPKRRPEARGTKRKSASTVAEPGIREKILAAARETIQRYGFRKTNMDDIARAMGRDRSSLYYYFPGKQDLMRAIVENEFAEISRAVRAEVARQKDAISRLRAYCTCRMEQVAARAVLYGETSPPDRNPSGILRMNELRRAFDEGEQTFFQDLLLGGIRDGQLRRLSEAEVVLFTRFAFAAIRGIELDLILDPARSTDLKTQIQVSLDIVLKGLQA
jgi:AcrR family transcriptional regulator